MSGIVHDALLVSPLAPSDLALMRDHLLRLDEGDRAQRFARTMRDEAIDAYLAQLDFSRDAFFGIVLGDAGERRLLALAHLAVASENGEAIGEVGVSVDAAWRRKGLASRLLHRTILHARNLALAEVLMYFLPYNTELIYLARCLGMRLSVGDGQGIARLRQAPPDGLSLGAEALEDWAFLADRSLHTWADGTQQNSGLLRRTLTEPD